jgi:hypothetical protein
MLKDLIVEDVAGLVTGLNFAEKVERSKELIRQAYEGGSCRSKQPRQGFDSRLAFGQNGRCRYTGLHRDDAI